MKNSYPEFSITISGDTEQARQWLLGLQSGGEIEVIRWGRRCNSYDGKCYQRVEIRLISGQTSLFPDPNRPKPETGSMVMGNR